MLNIRCENLTLPQSCCAAALYVTERDAVFMAGCKTTGYCRLMYGPSKVNSEAVAHVLIRAFTAILSI